MASIEFTDMDTDDFVQLETSDGTLYRRHAKNVWYQLIGESWEPCFSNEQELEKAYQDFVYKKSKQYLT